MAYRTWGRWLLTALGVSVLAGAGQLGVAYGFGIVQLTGAFTDATVNRWPAQLVWVGWFAASAAVVGAIVTERLARARGAMGTTAGRLGTAGASALGATVVAPLCMQPARAAELNNVDPVWAVAICAILGAVLGAGAALAVLLRPPLGWNVATVACGIWAIALLSSLPGLLGTGPLHTVRLGVPEPRWLSVDAAQRLAMLVLPLLALLAGAASGALARWRNHPPIIGGAAGAAGPVVVAFAYLTAGPGDAADRYQLAPYYGALIAVFAGVLGSTAATLVRWPLTAHDAADGAADPAIEPTDILRPLPTGPARPTGDEPDAATVGLAGTVDLARSGGPVDRGGTDDRGARRVAATVGEPLPHPAAEPVPAADVADVGDAAGPAHAATDDRPARTGGRGGRAPGSTPDPAPAHWDWPAPADAPAAEERLAAPVARQETSASVEPAPVTRQEAAPAAGEEAAPAAREQAAPAVRDEPAPAVRDEPVPVARGGADSRVAPAPREKRTRKPKDSAASGPVGPGPAVADPAASDPASSDPAGPSPALADPAASVPAGGAAGRSGARKRPGRATADAAASAGTDTRPGAAGAPAEVTAPVPGPAAAPANPDAAVPGPAASPVRPSVDHDRTDASAIRAAASPGHADAGQRRTDASTARAEEDPTGAGARPAVTDRSATGTGPAHADPGPVTGHAPAAGADSSARVVHQGAAGSVAGPGTPRGNPVPPAPRNPATAGPTAFPAPGRPGPAYFEAPSIDDLAPPAVPQPTWSAAEPVPPYAPGGPTEPEFIDPASLPRHRAPMPEPDLDRASNWDALASTARRAGPQPVDWAVPVARGPVGPSVGHDPAWSAAYPGEPPAGDNGSAAGVPAGATEESSGGLSRIRRGLFRRNRPRASEDAGTDRDNGGREMEPLPAQDADYVDWVAGLSHPRAGQDGSRRPPGRHHRD
ncbi:hypothetical protein ACFY2R_10045 [Micromonospora olivasterospora]|uniref:hypothetical protein n=1 Tax=Micromonospora olivasterospora TaxID=1880 RepID=UPI0031D4C64F